MSDTTGLRASDTERQAVVDQLSRHCADGRLTPTECEERIGRAWQARTVDELEVLLADLPRRRPGVDPSLRVHASTYAVVIGFLVLIWLVTTPTGYFWPIWPALGWGIGLALHATAATSSRLRR